MPYVEGFGTYPFGEEWLFDAVVRSYLPVLEVARDLTLTVTPVLADQLEDAGRARAAAALPGRLPDRLGGSGPARRRRRAAARLRGGASTATRRALELLDAAGGDPLAPFQRAAAEGRVALAASARHARAAAADGDAAPGCALQLDAGIRSHRRRFGWDGGFWLPECAYEPGLEWALAHEGVEWFCVDQSAHEEPLAALRPVATEAGPVALPIDWEAISWLWALDGYPSDPAYAQFDGKSLRGMRLWRVGGGAYDPAEAAAAARRQAGEFLAAIAARLRDYAAERGRRGLIVFAIDTELLGHWWSEGPLWLAAVLEGAAAAGVRLVTVPRGARRPRAGARGPCAAPAGARTRTSRPGTRRRSPTSPGRRGGWSCACSRAVRARPARRPGAERAARELLAAQASDWAFLDRRGQAGDYAWQRATDHAEALLRGHRMRP